MGMRVRPTNAHTNGELKIRKLMADDQESTADRASYLRRYRYMTTCSSGSTEVRKYESTSEVCTSVRKYGSILSYGNSTSGSTVSIGVQLYT